MAAKKAPQYLTPLPKKPGALPKVGALILSGPGGQPLPQSRSNALPGGNARAGRPPSNLGKYLLQPDDEVGVKMINDKPDTLKAVQEKFLGLKQLPYGLRPKGLKAAQAPKYTDTPDVLEKGRSNAISRGWRDPLGRKG